MYFSLARARMGNRAGRDLVLGGSPLSLALLWRPHPKRKKKKFGSGGRGDE